MFVKTSQGKVRMDAIQRVEEGRQSVTIYFGPDGGSRAEAETQLWMIAQREYSQQLVPAALGTFLVSCGWDDGEQEFYHWKEPVVAWTLGADGTLYPATAEGVPAGDYVILHANGIVSSPFMRSWESFDEWLKDAAEEAKAESQPVRIMKATS